MKTFPSLLIALAGLLVLQPTESRAEVDFAFFYDELAPYGEWVEVDEYGYCFQPHVDDGWRPYTEGYWADSDEGWLWVSTEPFGWATYHYGRWAMMNERGWVWVPGYEWGPGWVSWRQSDDYIGWAPLPPQVAYRPQTGIRFGISFGFGDVGPGYYNFIQPRYFGSPRYRDHVLPYERNVQIIQRTTNITNITQVVNDNRTIIYNNGPSRDLVRRHSEQPVRHLRIDRVEQDFTAARTPDRRLRNEFDGDNYRVVAPKVSRGKVEAKPEKVAERLSKADISDGYSRVADPKQAEQIRAVIRAQAENPKEQKEAVVARSGERPDSARPDAKSGDRPTREEILKAQTERSKEQAGAPLSAAGARPESARPDAKGEKKPSREEILKEQAERSKEQEGAPLSAAGARPDRPRMDSKGGKKPNPDEVLKAQSEFERKGKPGKGPEKAPEARPEMHDRGEKPSPGRMEKKESIGPRGPDREKPDNAPPAIRKAPDQDRPKAAAPGKPEKREQPKLDRRPPPQVEQRPQPKPQKRPEPKVSKPEPRPQPQVKKQERKPPQASKPQSDSRRDRPGGGGKPPSQRGDGEKKKKKE